MNHESAYMLAINTEKSQAEATCAYRISLRKKRKKKKSQIWCIIRLVNIWIREINYLDSSHEPLFPLGASVPRFIYGFGGNLEFRRFRLRVASERKEKKIVEHNKTQREKKKVVTLPWIGWEHLVPVQLGLAGSEKSIYIREKATAKAPYGTRTLMFIIFT